MTEVVGRFIGYVLAILMAWIARLFKVDAVIFVKSLRHF